MGKGIIVESAYICLETNELRIKFRSADDVNEFMRLLNDFVKMYSKEVADE